MDQYRARRMAVHFIMGAGHLGFTRHHECHHRRPAADRSGMLRDVAGADGTATEPPRRLAAFFGSLARFGLRVLRAVARAKLSTPASALGAPRFAASLLDLSSHSG